MIIKKNIRFTLLTIFLLVFFTESLSFLYLKIFSIDSELFLVENYAERTSEKTITLKKNFYKNNLHNTLYCILLLFLIGVGSFFSQF